MVRSQPTRRRPRRPEAARDNGTQRDLALVAAIRQKAGRRSRRTTEGPVNPLESLCTRLRRYDRSPARHSFEALCVAIIASCRASPLDGRSRRSATCRLDTPPPSPPRNGWPQVDQKPAALNSSGFDSQTLGVERLFDATADGGNYEKARAV